LELEDNIAISQEKVPNEQVQEKEIPE